MEPRIRWTRLRDMVLLVLLLAVGLLGLGEHAQRLDADARSAKVVGAKSALVASLRAQIDAQRLAGCAP
jgi:hypothetical protein